MGLGVQSHRSPDLFALSIAAHDSIDNRRLARFRVCEVLANRVDLDVLGVVDVNELLVDVRPISARVVERGVQLATLVPNLRRVSRSSN